MDEWPGWVRSRLLLVATVLEPERERNQRHRAQHDERQHDRQRLLRITTREDRECERGIAERTGIGNRDLLSERRVPRGEVAEQRRTRRDEQRVDDISPVELTEAK